MACSFEWNMEIRSSIYFETPSSLAVWRLTTYISMNEIQVFRANNKDKDIFRITPLAYLLRMKTIYTGQKIKFLQEGNFYFLTCRPHEGTKRGFSKVMSLALRKSHLWMRKSKLWLNERITANKFSFIAQCNKISDSQ